MLPGSPARCPGALILGQPHPSTTVLMESGASKRTACVPFTAAVFQACGGVGAARAVGERPGRGAWALQRVDDEHDHDDHRDAGDEPDENAKHVGLVLKRIEPAARAWCGIRDGSYNTYTVV